LVKRGPEGCVIGVARLSTEPSVSSLSRVYHPEAARPLRFHPPVAFCKHLRKLLCTLTIVRIVSPHSPLLPFVLGLVLLYLICYIYRSIPSPFRRSHSDIRSSPDIWSLPTPFRFMTETSACTPEGGLEALADALFRHHRLDIPCEGEGEHTPLTKDKAGRRDGQGRLYRYWTCTRCQPRTKRNCRSYIEAARKVLG
jgi:hypothetical protein